MDIFLESPEEVEELRRQKYRLRFEEPIISIEHGHSTWYKVAEAARELTLSKRTLLALKVFVLTLCTLGLGLFSAALREEWSSVFSGEQVKVLYAEKELHTKLCFEFFDDHVHQAVVIEGKEISKKDPKLMLKAIKQDPSALLYAHQNLRDSRAFTMQAMQTNGLALGYAKKNFRRDHSIVMAALTNNGLALKDARHFQNSHSHVLVAVQQNPAAYEFADESLKHDPKILAAAGLMADV